MKRIIVFMAALLAATQLFALSTSELSSLHGMLIKFYGYQRAGLKSGSANNCNTGFTDATHNGDNYNGSPLDGGWYDAGDYIKFGMNLSYSVYSLLKGYDVFPSGYDDKYSWDYKGPDGIPDILNEVKFATDYLIKAVISSSTIVLDVGDANSEHSNTSKANDPGGRSGSEIKLCTGADIPATYAACLALMSTLYRKYDAKYADECLAKAKIAFDFAKSKYASNAAICNPQGTFYTYPTVNGAVTRPENDRKVAAGIEMYRATNGADPLYKTWAQLPIKGIYDCMGYAYIGPLASFEVWRQGLASGPSDLLSSASFVANNIKKTGKFTDVFQNGGWGTARDAGTAAFTLALAYVYNANITERTTLLSRINNHVDWVVGKGTNNTQSFVGGFNGGPKSAHYRTNGWKAVPGGVVAGPDPTGKWEDNGQLYQFTEVAVDYNAGLIGGVAFLRAIANPGDGVKISTPFTATPKTNVDFTAGNVTLSAGFSKSVKWTIAIIGANGSKTFTGTGTSINEKWDGSADKGAILGGEIVIASLKIDGADIVAYDLAYTSPIEMAIVKNKKITPTGSDKIIDDFEDDDLSNKVGGTWSGFGTGTGISLSRTSIVTANGSKTMQLTGAVRTNDNKEWAGVKTTFNKDGSAINVGSIKSILFDLNSNKPAPFNLSVELEQSTITDNAFYGATVPVSATANSYRVDISDFAQPEWATSAKDLDLSKISAIRFTIYDSVGLVKLNLDNVYIEGFTPSTIARSAFQSDKDFRQCVSNNSLLYSIPQTSIGAFNISIFDVAGKNVLSKNFGNSAGKNIVFSLAALPSGMYTVVNSVNNIPLGERLKLVHTR